MVCTYCLGKVEEDDDFKCDQFQYAAVRFQLLVEAVVECEQERNGKARGDDFENGQLSEGSSLVRYQAPMDEN